MPEQKSAAIGSGSKPGQGGKMKLINRIATKCTLVASLATGVMMSGLIPATAADKPDDWPTYFRDGRGWRYSPLDQVNRENVANLGVAWIHQPGDIQDGLQATPIVIDGIIYYVGANNNVFAVNGKTGETIWHYKPNLDPMTQKIFWAARSRGITVGHGMVYIGSLDGRYIALDQKTGKVKWEKQLTDFKNCWGCNFSFPPQLAGDILFSGHTGGDDPVQGKIFGVNAYTGELVWTFNVIKDDSTSWPGDTGKVGGGAPWGVGVYDEKSDTIFIGTGNAAPDYFPEARRGDNLYTASILAIDAKTGKLKWHHQEVPNDSWDHDSTYELMTIERDGVEYLVHLNKGGFVTVLEKATGKLYNVWPFAKNVTWVKNIDPKTGALIGRVDPSTKEARLFCPSPIGARSWQHAAYNPKTKLWYSNGWETCAKVTSGAQKPEEVGIAAMYFGAADFELVAPPSGASARLDARDPFTGAVKWSVDYKKLPGVSAVLTTGGGLVFNGDAGGKFYAYDAATGKELWSFAAGSGIRSGPVTYAIDGEQYILVPSGLGGLAIGFAGGAFPDLIGQPGGAALIALKLPHR
jgi:alcohol dehydrogenase (cytochrome c)